MIGYPGKSGRYIYQSEASGYGSVTFLLVSDLGNGEMGKIRED